MPLDILQNPIKFNFSKSPVMCEIETDNLFVPLIPGVKAQGAYSFTVGVAVGNFIEIITETTLLHLDFIAGTNPATVGKLRTKAAGDSFTVFLNKIESDLLLNTYISTNYTITQDGLGLFTFDALATGTIFSLNNCVFNGTGINFYNYFSGVDDITTRLKENYQLTVELFMQPYKNSITYNSIMKVSKQPYVTGKVLFDLSRFLNSNLEYHFPEPDQQLPNLCEMVCKEFFIKIYEAFGNPSVQQTPVITPTIELEADGFTTIKGYTLKAGLSPANNKLLPNQQLAGYIWSYPLYLSAKPYRDTLKKNIPEYLFFCLPIDIPTNDVCLKFTIDSGGFIHDDYSPITVDSTTKGSVFCFPVNESGGIVDVLLTAGDETVTSVLVSVVGQTTGTVLSLPIRYSLSYQNPINQIVFLFTNSMGGVDTFTAKGKNEHSVEFKSDVVNRNYFTTDPYHIGMNSETQVYKKEVLTAYSGWLTKDALLWLEDLFLAQYKVVLTNDFKYAPIIITSKEYTKHDTDKSLFGIQIQYYYQNESMVTDKLAAAI